MKTQENYPLLALFFALVNRPLIEEFQAPGKLTGGSNQKREVSLDRPRVKGGVVPLSSEEITKAFDTIRSAIDERNSAQADVLKALEYRLQQGTSADLCSEYAIPGAPPQTSEKLVQRSNLASRFAVLLAAASIVVTAYRASESYSIGCITIVILYSIFIIWNAARRTSSNSTRGFAFPTYLMIALMIACMSVVAVR